MTLLVRVYVETYSADGTPALLREYVMDHDNPSQRSVLGQQCHYAFRAGQGIATIPEVTE